MILETLNILAQLMIYFISIFIILICRKATEAHIYIYGSDSQPFLYGDTLLSYLNFHGTPIILVNNKKVFTENLSMISQLSFQNHDDLKKKFLPELTLFLSLRISRTKTAKFDVSK